jgi:hypothetical protein
MRFASILRLPGLLAALVLAIGAGSSEGADLSLWARHQTQHRDWVSVDFRDPLNGLFLAARAGTEDQRNDATLTFTAIPAQRCEAEVVIVLKTSEAALKSGEYDATIAIGIDALAPWSLEARIVRQRNDPFMFVQPLEAVRSDLLRGRAAMTVTLPDGRYAAFSLAGFDSAWDAAVATCLSFLAP